jgi:inner membrane transporter RhtA
VRWHAAPVSERVPAWSLAVGAMLSVQLGAALSTRLFPLVGAGGTAWLRLSMGALVFLAMRRPRLRGVRRRDLLVALALGIATATMTVTFLSALARIPLGTAVAIEFLGPLGVAVARSHDRRSLVWPALALGGVVLLTEPWQGEIDPVGVALAALSGTSWATYIVLTQKVGDRFTGLEGLSITIPVAAVAASVVGLPQAWGHLTWGVLAAALGLAMLLPVLPFSWELMALRRLTAAAFGTLMALEPAIGLLAGLALLGQVPRAPQVLGVVLVVAAGIGAERGGRRHVVADVVDVAVPPGTA